MPCPGEGDPDTEVVFVGEGPGFNEDREGRPFVGRAGGLLVRLLAAIGWGREDVFITNVVKCRPPDNRDPQPDEIAACAPYLRRQLEVLDPAVVVTLGRYSMGTFLPGARIGQVHGTSAPADPETGARDALVFAMYHPAAALRTPALERESFDDIGRACPRVAARRPAIAAAASPRPRRASPATARRVDPRPAAPSEAPSLVAVIGPEPAPPVTGAHAPRRRRRTTTPSSPCSKPDPERTMADPNIPAPHHPARRGGRDRQELLRRRVRRRHRRHRLRAHVPGRGDVRHRPRRPRRHLPQGAAAPTSRRS